MDNDLDPGRLAEEVGIDAAALADFIGRLATAGLRISRSRPRGERLARRNSRIRADRARGLTPGQIARKEGMTRDAVKAVLRRSRCAGGTLGGCTR